MPFWAAIIVFIVISTVIGLIVLSLIGSDDSLSDSWFDRFL